MLRVYLDQNKWVDLSRGFDSDGADGARFRDVALEIEAAVEARRASFPLSVAHIFETWKRRKWEPRHALAATMTRISRNDAIAAPHALLHAELGSRAAAGGSVARPFCSPWSRSAGASLTLAAQRQRSFSMRAARRSSRPWAASTPKPATDRARRAAARGAARGPPVRGHRAAAAGVRRRTSRRQQNEQAQRFKQHSADKDTRRRTVAYLTLMDIRDADIGGARPRRADVARPRASWARTG